jgi:hypothetical protein
LILTIICVFVCLGFSYLYFEKYLTEEEITISVINKEKFGNEDGKYLIFTPNEVFETTNRFYQGNSDAENIYKKLERGVTYRVKVVGLYLPKIPRLRNIIEIISTELGKNTHP